MVKPVNLQPWHASYSLGPHKLAPSLAPYPLKPLHAILDSSVARYPLSTAIDYCGSKIKYAELKKLCDSLAAALVRLGVKRGDRVVTVLPNCPQSIISTFAILKAGAVHVPCSILSKTPELAREIKQAGANTVIAPAEHYSSLRPALAGPGLENIIVTSLRDFTAAQPASSRAPKGARQLRTLIAGVNSGPARVRIDPVKDLAYLAFTGGATGVPKGVMLTHYNRLCNIRQGLPWVMTYYRRYLRGRASIMIAVPLSHLYGDWIMLSAIYWGLRIVLVQDPRDTGAMLKLLAQKRPLLAGMVPTQLMQLGAGDLPGVSVRLISGASPLPLDVRQSVLQRMNAPVTEGYGLTEASPVTHINLAGLSRDFRFSSRQPRRKDGIGVPVPDTEVKLVDEETGQVCPAGRAGHMYIKGPQVMKGYWPEPGRGLVDGWLPTGDIACMDEDGYFFLLDRIKDMVNVSGYKVYTQVIDEILFGHPAVSMAVTVGVPDPERPGSERIKAFIRLKDDYRGKVNAAEIIDFCRARCPPYAVPRFVEFKEELPLTAAQKLSKRELREMK